MPAEKIHGCNQSPFDVRVAWSGGPDAGTVQVAALAADGADRILGYVNEWLASAKMPQIDVEKLRSSMTVPADLVGVIPDYQPFFDGWHVDLDRSGINRMIRALRRARDSAFGKDE